VWLALIFSIVLLYLVNQFGKREGKYNIFHVIGILLRQDPDMSDKNPIFLTFSIFNIIYSGIYEFYITSELVVPPVKEPFSTLEEFVDERYSLFSSSTAAGLIPTNVQILTDPKFIITLGLQS
jgi:hypothetical protein